MCRNTIYVLKGRENGGPLGERHSTCGHMVFMAHHTNPREYNFIFYILILFIIVAGIVERIKGISNGNLTICNFVVNTNKIQVNDD